MAPRFVLKDTCVHVRAPEKKRKEKRKKKIGGNVQRKGAEIVEEV